MGLSSGESRDVFHAAIAADDATWALSIGLVALAYYKDNSPGLAGIARRAIDQALADHRKSGRRGGSM